tara:strand:- start:243 stop:683 length:441 start_codon:yes stop_codon:yes gene_type:complete
MHRFFLLALTAGIALPIASCSVKKEASLKNKPVVIETLISATESWNGDPYKYPKGTAQMTLQRITAQPGFKTPLHFHSQPGIAYLVKGNLSCGTTDGQALKVVPGDSFATSQDTVHYCESVGNEAALVFVASAGIKGQELTVPYKN